MKDEIKEIFNKYGKEKYNDEYCLKFETYIIELQELKKIYDWITNLQEENQTLKNQLDFIEEQNHIIEKLKKENKIIKSQLNICSQDLYMENLKLKLENERLKELCDKYEEEHSTKFNEWVFDKRENERLNNVINEANKCILDFLQTEEYTKVDGLAIADNYMRLMQILETKIGGK